MKILLLDNYDSFTYNLFQYLGELDEPPLVFRNDRITLTAIRELAPDRIVISPGPGNPENDNYFGVCKSVILELGPRIPVLGVCLGHQGIIHAFGGKIIRAAQPMHGKTSSILHDQKGLFRGLPSPFEAMRYHSLVGDPALLPSCLQATAWTEDGVLMAVRHRSYPIYGVQFHPESIGTGEGKRLLANFLTFSRDA
jgi:anthranilate synthase component 2